MKTSLIKTLSIDIETYSSNDLSKCGVYKYAESLDKPKKVETTLFSWFKKLNIFKVKTS